MYMYMVYIVYVHNIRRSTADTGYRRRGGPRYIRHLGYNAGLIHGSRGPRYNGFPLYKPISDSPKIKKKKISTDDKRKIN